MKKSEKDRAEERWEMVQLLRERYHIHDARVLHAMEEVPRHLFIPAAFRPFVDPYGDHPCPIGHDQTISQPFFYGVCQPLLPIIRSFPCSKRLSG